MLEEVLQKNVIVNLANGSTVEGFVVKIDEEFIKIVELDNGKVIVRKSDISYVKVYDGSPKRISTPNITDVADDENSYAMPHQVVQQSHQQPQRQQFYSIRGNRAHPQSDYSMENPNFNPTGGPKFERKT